MPVWGRIPMTLIMTPVEILGKFTKPFALSIRLFANMTAGHVMVLALISIVFMFGSYWIGLLPVVAAVGIMCLELFVAALQAYVFTLLVSSFIGQIRTAEHH
jgi:F-type H+-transporting ATPase subunit a